MSAQESLGNTLDMSPFRNQVVELYKQVKITSQEAVKSLGISEPEFDARVAASINGSEKTTSGDGIDMTRFEICVVDLYEHKKIPSKDALKSLGQVVYDELIPVA